MESLYELAILSGLICGIFLGFLFLLIDILRKKFMNPLNFLALLCGLATLSFIGRHFGGSYIPLISYDDVWEVWSFNTTLTLSTFIFYYFSLGLQSARGNK